MKLSDVKDKIDAFFDDISDEELFDMLVNEYKMPVIYYVDMPDAKHEFDDKLFVKYSGLGNSSCVNNTTETSDISSTTASGEIAVHSQKCEVEELNNNFNPMSFAA